jgi:branched-subunit amino acid aminotransferase/4-amino-4-deoxychorismate lyase
MPVTRVAGFTINQGQVGPIAKGLRAALHAEMSR